MDKVKLLKILKKSNIRVIGNKIYKKDLKRLKSYLSLAELSETKVNKRIVNVFENYLYMDAATKNYLKKIYEDSYRYGYKIVFRDNFTNSTYISTQQLYDRFDDHPDIQNEDLVFLEKLADKDHAAMKDIFNRNVAIKGYEENFIYIIYRDHYIDGSDDMANKITEVPEGLDIEKVKILSQNAYSDGVQERIRILATEAIQALAEDILEDIHGMPYRKEEESEEEESEEEESEEKEGAPA